MSKSILQAAALLLSLSFAHSAHADAIVLLSNTGSTYVYGLTFTDSPTYFSRNNKITISGLSGITSVSASNFANYLGYTSSTPTSIVLSMAGSGTYAAGATQTLYTVVAGSPIAFQYSIQEASMTESGPVTVTPEPASLLLLATGALLLGFRPIRALLHTPRRSALAQG